jgi:S1-C subfamily serine protease
MSALKDLSNDIAAVVEKASKSVVRVDARRGRAGTGIVWDSGLVLTANHVVEQEEDITVVVDDKSTKASLVGRDPATDLALLKVDGLSAPAISSQGRSCSPSAGPEISRRPSARSAPCPPRGGDGAAARSST